MISLKKKILNKRIDIAIIGLGYVGLELALNIAKKKYNVIGFDKNEKKIELIKKNRSPINTIKNERIRLLNKKNLHSLNNIDLLAKCDVIIICLPTPLKKNLKPDNKYLIECLNTIFPYLRKNQILILESTVHPLATQKIFGNKISKKFDIGKNFFLCFSPERISPGQHEGRHAYLNITKLVSGRTKNCLKIINYLYSKIFKKIHECDSIEIAEFTKLYENSYRSINIGFANQMKIIADKLNMNIFDIIKASSTKPFGFTKFHPGPGVGGHCIPLDPMFISYAAKKLRINSDFIHLARRVNFEVTNWVVDKIKKNLKKKDKVLLMGIAYKKNVDDTRESPAVSILSKLSKSCRVNYFDPFVENVKIKNKLFRSIKKLNYQQLGKYNAVLITTNHDNFNYKKILKYSKRIFDTRGVYQNQKNKKIVFC